MRTDVIDAARGALMGAFAGDAAGAVLEFLGRSPTAAEVDGAMTMPGGGVWRVAPGQITDDSEMAISLARAIVASGGFDLEAIAMAYVRWCASHPFDIGNTTIAALGAASKLSAATLQVAGGARVVVAKSAQAHSMGSKANGTLMRCVPLGISGWRTPEAELVARTRADARLTHPNPACGDSTAAYVLAVAHLVAHPGDGEGAWDRAVAWARDHADPEVRGWLVDVEAGRRPAYHPMAGFVRIAFCHAFHHLRHGTSWDAGVRETLAGGGDTDTNAAIVGGLLGALGGRASIPAAAAEAVLGCNTEMARPRPDFLHPRDLDHLAVQLLS